MLVVFNEVVDVAVVFDEVVVDLSVVVVDVFAVVAVLPP